MTYNLIRKIHAALAGIGVALLAIATVFVVTAVPSINMNHLVYLFMLAFVTGFSLWRFTELEKKTQPNTNP